MTDYTFLVDVVVDSPTPPVSVDVYTGVAGSQGPPGPVGPPGPTSFSQMTGVATYAQLPPDVQAVPIPFAFNGKPNAGTAVYVPMSVALTIAPGLAGTVVYCAAPATANASFILSKVAPSGASTPIGSVTVTPTSHTSCVLSGPGGALSIGDTLQLLAPPQDATLANVGINVLCKRT